MSVTRSDENGERRKPIYTLRDNVDILFKQPPPHYICCTYIYTHSSTYGIFPRTIPSVDKSRSIPFHPYPPPLARHVTPHLCVCVHSEKRTCVVNRVRRLYCTTRRRVAAADAEYIYVHVCVLYVSTHIYILYTLYIYI